MARHRLEGAGCQCQPAVSDPPGDGRWRSPGPGVEVEKQPAAFKGIHKKEEFFGGAEKWAKTGDFVGRKEKFFIGAGGTFLSKFHFLVGTEKSL